MYPPWITFKFFLIPPDEAKGLKEIPPALPAGRDLFNLAHIIMENQNLYKPQIENTNMAKSQKKVFSITDTISGDAEKSELDNSTISRPQQETSERERRLIPYMTYYVTQSLTNSNIGTRQSNVFVPITAPREDIFHLDTVTKIPLNNLQNVSPQQIEILPKPVDRYQSPSLLTPAIQTNHYNKAKEESRIFPYVYRLEPGIIRPQIEPQGQPQQIPSGSQPPQVIKVNPVPLEQKYSALQLIKIIPVMTKISLEDRLPKFFNPPQHHHSRAKLYTLMPDMHLSNLPVLNENSFQENKLYPGHTLRGNVQFRLISPSLSANSNKIAKTVFKTTTSLPYTDVKFFNNGRISYAESNPYNIPITHFSQINSPSTEYGREPLINTEPTFTDEKYVSIIPNQQKIYYEQKVNDDQKEETRDSVQSQGAEQLPRLRVPQEEKIRFLTSATPVPVTNDLESSYWKVNDNEHNKKIYNNQPLNNVLSLLKETNKLPQNLTPGNIDTGIRTLALILERLQNQKNQHSTQIPVTGPTTVMPSAINVKQNHQNSKKVHSFPEKSGTSTPGKPGIDYPIYSSIPQTNFDCSTQRYKGFFGDPDTNCQVWHYCDLNGGQASFLCPNGTIFSQVALTCDWWFNVKCASTSQLYVLNERLYKYILPFSPSFPEDYSGPVVDKYLAAKFKEMEAKSKAKALKSLTNSTTTAKPEITTESSLEQTTKSIEDFQIPITEK